MVKLIKGDNGIRSERITRQNVLNAVKQIEKRKIRLRPSIGYDVIKEGRRYPPKEMIRISYKLQPDKR